MNIAIDTTKHELTTQHWRALVASRQLCPLFDQTVDALAVPEPSNLRLIVLTCVQAHQETPVSAPKGFPAVYTRANPRTLSTRVHLSGDSVAQLVLV